MFIYGLDRRVAGLIRLIGLALIVWSVATSAHHPGAGGRGLVVTVLLAVDVVAWLVLMGRPGRDRGVTIELYVMAVAGGALCGATTGSAASAFVFAAVAAAGLRGRLGGALALAVAGTAALAVTTLLYAGSGVGLLAYALGFVAAALAASYSRESVVRAEQAELLLAQAQRTHEEQLRALRLEESARLAREIHDVLAHTLAGLVIQLEATTALFEQGAERQDVLVRLRRAHELAREGLAETRRAVGVLRGEEAAPLWGGIDALIASHRETGAGDVRLTVDGDERRLAGPVGDTVLRVIQEALTNVRKHAPGSDVTVTVDAGRSGADEVVAVIADHGAADDALTAPGGLTHTGGGFGLRGMRERVQAVGGTLSAGPDGSGWRVELRAPGPGGGSAGAR